MASRYRTYEFNGWSYSYDPRVGVWRATRNGEELNAWTKTELIWVMDHIDIPHLQPITQFCRLRQVDPL